MEKKAMQTKMAFEQMHDDLSGIKCAVRYDAFANDSEGEIVFERDEFTRVAFAPDDITWLIDSLETIKAELLQHYAFLGLDK